MSAEPLLPGNLSLTYRLVLVTLGGTLLLAASVLLALNVGSTSISPRELFQALLGSGDSSLNLVVWELRVPRILLAALTGAALSLAGLTLQSLLRNPLADPYIVGTSSGAGLGAAIAIVLGLSVWLVPALAFAGAVGAVAAVYQLARVDRALPMHTFLLAGVVVSAFLGSMVSLVLSLSRQDLPKIIFWLMGNLSSARWEAIQPLTPLILVGFLGIFHQSLNLNLLALGEEQAAQLGVEVEPVKRRLLGLTSLLTAAAVAVAGLIGFVGLVVPHASRRLLGAEHRLLVPASALLGSSFLVLADAISRLLLPSGEIPVGIVTSLVGAPFFLYLLRYQGQR